MNGSRDFARRENRESNTTATALNFGMCVTRRVGMILVLLLASVVLALVALRAVWQHHTAKRIAIASPNGIDSLEKIKLRGV